ncbi:MAG: hypothetical protein OXU61_06680 [Gammaproteobacteria bacterium]|nr:hypothetical protein [Gammaproteobacteria bacterium]
MPVCAKAGTPGGTGRRSVLMASRVLPQPAHMSIPGPALPLYGPNRAILEKLGGAAMTAEAAECPEVPKSMKGRSWPVRCLCVAARRNRLPGEGRVHAPVRAERRRWRLNQWRLELR